MEDSDLVKAGLGLSRRDFRGGLLAESCFVWLLETLDLGFPDPSFWLSLRLPSDGCLEALGLGFFVASTILEGSFPIWLICCSAEDCSFPLERSSVEPFMSFSCLR